MLAWDPEVANFFSRGRLCVCNLDCNSLAKARRRAASRTWGATSLPAYGFGSSPPRLNWRADDASSRSCYAATTAPRRRRSCAPDSSGWRPIVVGLPSLGADR